MQARSFRAADVEIGYNRAMFRTFRFAAVVFVAGFGLIAASLNVHAQDDTDRRGRKYKAPPPTARIEVTILKDVNGKPIENAAVIFHPMVGEKDNGNMELKTNEDGKTIIDVLPIGDTVRLQVIARGFQTFGEDYKIDKAAMAIEIKMKRPGEQYSIYKAHDPGEVGGKSADGGKTAEPAKDAAAKDAAPAKNADSKDAEKDKPADPASQPDAQPSQPQPQLQ
jgi:hypothetical protein